MSMSTRSRGFWERSCFLRRGWWGRCQFSARGSGSSPSSTDALRLETDDFSADVARRHRLEPLLQHVGDPDEPAAQLTLLQARIEPVFHGTEVLLAESGQKLHTIGVEVARLMGINIDSE